MKNILLTLAALCVLYSTLHAQSFPSAIPGLQLRLELVDHPASFNTTLGTWDDVSSGVGNSFAPGGSTVPALVVNSGFKAVHFNGTSDLLRESAGLSNGNGFNSTEATLFVVRASDANQQCSNTPSWGNYQTMLSIAAPDNSTTTSYYSYLDEMGMGSDWALHHSFSGGYNLRDHQCFGNLSHNQPVVLTARLGTNPNDIDYYVNDIASAQPVQSPSFGAVPYSPIQRFIIIGARFQPVSVGGTVPTTPGDFFNGDIFEIIAYNRSLTPGEIHQVNEYLKCKYNITYSNASCNVQPVCQSCAFTDPATGQQVTPVSGSLTVNYTGANSNGDCTFQVIANVTLIPAYAVTGYEWHFPDGTTAYTATASLSDVQNFTLSAGTAGLPVSVTVQTINTAYKSGDPNWCCAATMRRTVWCDAFGNGGSN